VAQAEANQMTVVIPPKKNRKQPRAYDRDLYWHRHLVENAFLHLKRWRGIATRYAKNTASFLTAVQIRCVALWSSILWQHYLNKLEHLFLQQVFCPADGVKLSSNLQLNPNPHLDHLINRYPEILDSAGGVMEKKSK
jgi:hypothetical protein